MDRKKEVEQIVTSFLPKEEGYQKTVLEAMNYSVSAGGKRLRPMLMLETYRMFGGTSKVIEPFMAAIEMIHTYSLNREKLQLAKEDMPVLHPLPRVDEIAYDVDDDSRAAYFQQVQNGKYMRMALILSLLGIEDPQTGEKILELGES